MIKLTYVLAGMEATLTEDKAAYDKLLEGCNSPEEKRKALAEIYEWEEGVISEGVDANTLQTTRPTRIKEACEHLTRIVSYFVFELNAEY